MKNKILLLVSGLSMMVCVFLGACKPKQHSDKPVVYVTIEPLRFFAEQIAGDHYLVQSMVPKGSSPETYDPTPQQLIELTESQAFLFVGKLGFEQQWLQKLKENTPTVKFCEAGNGIRYIEGHHHEGEEEGLDPHIWTTPSNAIQISRNICNLFCELDTAHQEEYVKNLGQLVTRIQQTDAEIRQITEEGIQKTFAIYHPSLTYFANDYGLTQLSIEEEGKEPSPAQLQALIKQCKEEGVKVIFIQQEFNTHNAEIIAESCGARLVQINPLNYDWMEEMVNIAKSLKK